MTETTESRPRIATLGLPGFDWLPGFERLLDIPKTTRCVVVRWHVDSATEILTGLRERCPQARTVAWLPTSEVVAVQAALDTGYDDVAIGEAHLKHRLRALGWELDLVEGYMERQLAHNGLVEFIDQISARPELRDVLRTSVLGMRELFGIDRVTVVFVRPGDEYGYVVMEREKRVDNVVVRVQDYPELLELMRRREPIVIPDIFGAGLLSGVKNKLEEAEVSHRSAVLFPLLRKREVVGALFLRSETPQLAPDDKLLGMGRLIASVTAVAIGHALEHDMLQTEQRALRRKTESTLEELKNLKQFSEFFEKANDGIIVLSVTGVIRYANASALGILACGRRQITGTDFRELLLADSRAIVERVMEGYSVGDKRGYVDLSVVTEHVSRLVVSASIRYLEDLDSILITFRDVTELRELQNELKQTKEFLENLIQSSVDAIVAADTKGFIILFNRAAERILGYRAQDVVGQLHVTQLYCDGVAHDVMTRLRSDLHGGRGRLGVTRHDIVTSDNQTVPVNFTAAIIYEDGREVATVGIFTDLRERLEIEAKLRQVEEELKMTERQTIAIELAGAAAHELNQPLTSIMGYAELLKIRLDDNGSHTKPVNRICRETERMAQIVKRLGHITRYETKSYVGESTILNLGQETGYVESAAGAAVVGEEPTSGD